ncbi:hypothetical protein KAR10_02650 [bacterium]|nr:hypothetical protein [bacterium]
MKIGLDELVRYRNEWPELLEESWARVKRAYINKNSNACQLGYFTFIKRLRSLGILQYLVDGDQHGFFESCHQASLAFYRCNLQITYGMPHDPNLYSATNSRGFFDSLLTRGYEDSKPIAASMSYELRPQVDDPVHFGFVMFIITFLLDAPVAYERSLLALKEIEKEGFDSGIEIAICEALCNSDTKQFSDGLTKYLERRVIQIEENDNVKLGEQFIFVEALSLIRLARDVNIPVTIEHTLAPLDLQKDYPPVDSFAQGELPQLDPRMKDSSFWADWSTVESW